MSKPTSGHFSGTTGAKNNYSQPWKSVTGGNSSALGRNILKSMGVDSKIKWKGYQAQHIIPAQLRKHPVLQKIGINLDDASNGIFLQIPQHTVSTRSRHRGYHSTYTAFVKSELDKMNLSQSKHDLRKQVSTLQSRLRRLQDSGLPLYRRDGATVDLWKRSLSRLQ